MVPPWAEGHFCDHPFVSLLAENSVCVLKKWCLATHFQAAAWEHCSALLFQSEEMLLGEISLATRIYHLSVAWSTVFSTLFSQCSINLCCKSLYLNHLRLSFQQYKQNSNLVLKHKKYYYVDSLCVGQYFITSLASLYSQDKRWSGQVSPMSFKRCQKQRFWEAPTQAYGSRLLRENV